MVNTIWLNIGLGLFFLVFSFPHIMDGLLQGRLPKFGKGNSGIRNRTEREGMATGREGEVGESWHLPCRSSGYLRSGQSLRTQQSQSV